MSNSTVDQHDIKNSDIENVNFRPLSPLADDSLALSVGKTNFGVGPYHYFIEVIADGRKQSLSMSYETFRNLVAEMVKLL